MTCIEFQRVLPEMLEGAGSAAQEAHLKSCPMCSGLVSDLQAIAEGARQLRTSEEPSPRVWNSIEITLRQEGLIRKPEPARQRFAVPSFASRWGAARWLVPAAAVLLLGFVLWLNNRPITRVAEEQAANSPGMAVSPQASVASDTDDQQMLAEVAQAAPLMKAAYEDNLRSVNAYIRDAQWSVEQNPNDEEAREYLLQAYEQKAMLYEMALDRSLP